MSEPFLAEIRMFGFSFAPRGWAGLDGQILPINQNQSLYSLLGTTYGGDGRTTFALPELRGRTPMHRSAAHSLGQKDGQESVALIEPELPAHDHPAKASSAAADSPSPGGNIFATELAPDAAYRAPEAATMTSLQPGTVTNQGGGMAHNNMQPFLAVNFCIALQGLFPSRN
ncbi:Microcystin-dependent protein [Roseivivax lentus]|uniref:Microcystin-dependent protein n=1 Tax=Roseivivax lentus TaxID=633194 RepID=A0A1N7PRD6_9RHOB|nr:tail fiber protein [Roseivivax lentus]SIT13110.1 Microcystin-dependent protein [Roseivivax lentus]